MKHNKQNMYVKLFIPGLVILALLMVNCGKSDKKSDEKVAGQLLEHLNSQLPESGFKTDLKKSTVESSKNKRYRVTFKDSSFTTDLVQALKPFNKEEIPYNALIEEMVIIYAPEENCFDLQSLKGLKVDADVSKLAEKNKSAQFEKFKMKKISVSVGKIAFKNWDMSRCGKTDKEDHGNRNGKPLDAAVEDLKLEMDGSDAKGENLSIILDVKKIKNVKEGINDPAISTYFFKKDAAPPDLRKTLQKGLSIGDVNVDVGKVKVSIKKNGIKIGDGTIDNVSYSQFSKPDEARTYFIFGNSIGIKNIELSVPDKKETELLYNIKELKYMFSLEHVTPEAAMAFIDIMKKSIELRDQTDNANMQAITIQAMTLMNEIMKSKPQAKFSISPLKHYFGELEAKADIRLQNLFQPDAKITLDILKIDKALKKIEDSHLFSSSDLKSISEEVDKYMVRKENGDASLTLELKPDQPGKYFLNGKPVIRKLSSNPFMPF